MSRNSLTGWYLRMLSRNAKQLLSICNTIVADAYFSKESFVSGAISLGFNIISRFRDDVNIKYIYHGPKTGKKGRPQKFVGKVNLAELDMNVFREEASTDDNQTSDLTMEGRIIITAGNNKPGRKQSYPPYFKKNKNFWYILTVVNCRRGDEFADGRAGSTCKSRYNRKTRIRTSIQDLL